MYNHQSLFEFLKSHPTEQDCINRLEQLRGNGDPISPYDPNSKIYKCANNGYKCKNTGKFFNVRTGTMFARSKLPLQKGFVAGYLFASHKKGISSCQLGRDLGITQKTAWFVLDDLRNSLKQSNFIKEMLEGDIEIDETFIGGKNGNRHRDKKVPNCQGWSGIDKTPVLGMIEKKNGILITQVVPNTQQNTLEPIIRANVKGKSTVSTDEGHAYKDLGKGFIHQIVNHRIKQYVNGKATTNAIENPWSHLKRTIYGTYHGVSKKHLSKYVDEFTFRFNTRKYSEQERFNFALSSAVGKCLTYRELINY